MEKKGNRLMQPAYKGLPSDAKKLQDVANGGKLLPRGGRRRESAGGSTPTKNETTRNKPNAQHSFKAFDKRPRPRGTPSATTTMDRTEAAGIVDGKEAELGSVLSPGSKKQNLNHLLNFQYSTHGVESRYNLRQFDCRSYGTRNSFSKHHKHYNKEHYLLNNCNFVVNSKGDYTQCMVNPDALVNWDLIEQVNVQVTENPSCPICLYPPVAAKITRCGHIYCWPCILHYLSLSDKTWRKCPICYESVHNQDLKSVVSVLHDTYNVGDTITFKLMKRPKASLTTYPASAVVKKDDEVFKLSEVVLGIQSKLLAASSCEIISIIARETAELQSQLLESEDCPENCFIEQALVLLKERKVAIGEEMDVSINRMNSEYESNVESIPIDSLEIRDPASQKKFYYFYQGSDGQHIFLHPLNAEMLVKKYGSLEYSPAILEGPILEKEDKIVTDVLRNKSGYLQHLPLTCPFEVAEINLNAYIDKDTMAHFKEQMDKRRKTRQRKAKEEKRREKRITAENERQMGKFPTPEIHLESPSHFPDFEPRVRTESTSTIPSEGISDEVTPPSSFTEYSGPSFAKTLASSPKRETPTWPALKSPAANATPVKLIVATGPNMKATSSRIRTHSDSDIEPDDFTTFHPSTNYFCDIVEKAMSEQRNKYDDASGDASQSGKKKGKKGKKAKKVLFSSLMPRY